MKCVVFESPKKWHKWLIKVYLALGYRVYVIEPFLAYHHNRGKIRFFPPSLPEFVQKFVSNGKIFILRADEISSEEIYYLSADKAVEVVESVFGEYRERYERLFQYVSDTLKSPVAENGFRKDFCDRLAEFYSLNMFLARIEDYFETSGSVVVYPNTNVCSYLFIKKLLLNSDQEFSKHPNIRFPIQCYVSGFLEKVKRSLVSTAELFAQALMSGFCGKHRLPRKQGKTDFTCGITIMGPRQLEENNQRGPDFLVDNEAIPASEVVYFPIMNLTKNHQERLSKLQGEVYLPPKVGRLYSHFNEWKKLLLFAVRTRFLQNANEVDCACRIFFSYFSWSMVMEVVRVKHFITHCDFGVNHVGRNIALNQAGVKTWYFTDAIGHGVYFQKKDKCRMHHPFWTYLYYDHFVTWNSSFAEYYKEHPGTFNEAHVVGCLWGEHIQEKNKARQRATTFAVGNYKGHFILGCFDSTYSRNGLTSYVEGLAFATHLLRLADECPDIHIILKEKKDRNIHYTLDPLNGPKLLEVYDKMDAHPRITICSNEVDASELISISDMIVSFPFTSTTFEALSADKPSIWHDPLGYYRNTPYGRIGGVTTHGYEDLKEKVLNAKSNLSHNYSNPIPKDSPLMDPFRDGKAIERFRALLVAS